MPVGGTSADAPKLWQIQPEGYKIVPSLRVTADNLSMGDGSVLHPRWKTGLVATFTVAFLKSLGGAAVEPACGAMLREMNEELVLHLNAIRDYANDAVQGRLLWTPTGLGGSRRMLTDVQVLAWPEPGRDGLEKQVTFAIETPFPYAIDLTETQTEIADGATVTINNPGNVEFKPVIRVNGATSSFTIENVTIDRQINYDDSQPGASPVGTAYAEIDHFQGTIRQNGDGDNLIAGIDPTTTDFFSLAVGDNEIFVSGASVLVLSNGAWG